MESGKCFTLRSAWKRVALVGLMICFAPDASNAEDSASVTLDHVFGADIYDSTKLPAGREITFNVRLTNLMQATQVGISNGFRIYSPDGATWLPGTKNVATLDTNLYARFINPPEIAPLVWLDSEHLCGFSMFDGYCFSRTRSDHDNNPQTPYLFGEGSDTVGLVGAVQHCGSGLKPGFDYVGWSISLDSVPSSGVGRSICIDSSFFYNSGYWAWTSQSGVIYPDWDGPHCFEIVDCCLGMRGNFDHDNGDRIDVGDLSAMVAYMFRGGSAPRCQAESNVDGFGPSLPDISDLSWLVAYMFRGGPPPAQCQ